MFFHFVLNVFLVLWIFLTLVSRCFSIYNLRILFNCIFLDWPFQWFCLKLLHILHVPRIWILTLKFQIIILFLKRYMKWSSDSWKLKFIINIFILKPLLNFLFENNELILHFRIDIPLFIRRPKSPEGIAHYISKSCFLLLSKYILSKLT